MPIVFCLALGSRFRTYYDFGYVALDIIHAVASDSGEYTVRATNHLGSAHTSACVRVIDHSSIVTDTQNESSLEQIQMLEDSSRHRRHVQEDITVIQAPQFTRYWSTLWKFLENLVLHYLFLH